MGCHLLLQGIFLTQVSNPCLLCFLHFRQILYNCNTWELLFFFNLFIYFNWRLITLQYCSGFRQTLTWISHRRTCVPHPEPPSHLPPHPILQSHPSAPALRTLSHASNLDWRSVSHMIIYMFQCYSLKSSHLTFSHRVQKTVLYICVSFAVLRIGSSLPSF